MEWADKRLESIFKTTRFTNVERCSSRSLLKAREKARHARKTLADGKNPIETKRKARAVKAGTNVRASRRRGDRGQGTRVAQ
jgi:hypothetical protein